MGRKKADDEQPFETTVRAQFRNRQAYEDFVSGRHHSDKGLRDEKGHLTSQPNIRLVDDDDAAIRDSSTSPQPAEQYVYIQNVREESNPIAEEMAAELGKELGEFLVALLEDPQVQAFLKQTAHKARLKLVQFAGKTKSFVKTVLFARNTVLDLSPSSVEGKTGSNSEEIIEAEMVPDDEPVMMTDSEYAAKQEEAQKLEKDMHAMLMRLRQIKHDLDNASITPEEAFQITADSMQQLPPSQLLEIESTCRSSGVDLNTIISSTSGARAPKVQ